MESDSLPIAAPLLMARVALATCEPTGEHGEQQ
jgi:hypothetical protein